MVIWVSHLQGGKPHHLSVVLNHLYCNCVSSGPTCNETTYFRLRLFRRKHKSIQYRRPVTYPMHEILAIKAYFYAGLRCFSICEAASSRNLPHILLVYNIKFLSRHRQAVWQHARLPTWLHAPSTTHAFALFSQACHAWHHSSTACSQARPTPRLFCATTDLSLLREGVVAVKAIIMDEGSECVCVCESKCEHVLVSLPLIR